MGNGPRGFGAIVKSCFIAEVPNTVEDCLNQIACSRTVFIIRAKSFIEEDRVDIRQKGEAKEGGENWAEKRPHPLSSTTVKEAVIYCFFPGTHGASVRIDIAPSV